MSQLPAKTFSITQAAQQLGLNPKTLRRWEKDAKFVAQRTLGNQRRYSPQDIAVLKKIKAGKITSLPHLDQVLTPSQTAKKFHVSLATIRRWTKTKKLQLTIDQHLNQGYSAKQIHQLTSRPQPVSPPSSPSPTPPPSSTTTPPSFSPPSPSSTSHPLSVPWLKQPLVQKLFVYSTLATIILSLTLTYLFLKKPDQPASPTAEQILGAQDIQIALPKTASFLDGHLTIGSDTGDLSFLDQYGNLFVKNNALIQNSLTTSVLNLIPTTKPDQDQIGRQYVDQNTGDLMFFDGLNWISLNQASGSASLSLQQIYDANQTDLLAENQSLNLTLGNSVATNSATSLKLTLAGPQSRFVIFGGASQEILSIDDDNPFPIILHQPTQILGNLYAPKFIDTSSSDFFLDPSATDLSLSLAGNATISATLSFSQNNQFLTSANANYLTFSKGLSVGGRTDWYFNSDGHLKANQASLSDLSVDNLQLKDSQLKVTSNDSLNLFNRHDQGLVITTSGYVGLNTTSPTELLEVKDGNIKITNGSLIVTNTSGDYEFPDYVFEPDYPLLSPLELQEFITTYHHLPGVPSRDTIQSQGMNLSRLILNLLEKTEENVLYILDLYQKFGSLSARVNQLEASLADKLNNQADQSANQSSDLLTPLASDHIATQILQSQVIKPLDNQDLIIQSTSGKILASVSHQGQASFSGQLSAPQITTHQLQAQELTTDHLTADTIVADQLIASKIKAGTIEGLREKLQDLINPSPSDSSLEDNLSASESAAVASLITTILNDPSTASPSSYLDLKGLNSDFGFFSDYLAVMGSAVITDLEINNTLSINHSLVLASNSLSSLDNTLYLQPSGNGSINLLAGLMVLDASGQVTINGHLAVSGTIAASQLKAQSLIASQLNPPSDNDLTINLATQSAVTIYNQILGQVASIDASGSASFNHLSLQAAGTATISAGTNHISVITPHLTPSSQVIITFGSSYAPATKYWVIKQPPDYQFTIYVNYPVKQDTLVDWLIIN